MSKYFDYVDAMPVGDFIGLLLIIVAICLISLFQSLARAPVDPSWSKSEKERTLRPEPKTLEGKVLPTTRLD